MIREFRDEYAWLSNMAPFEKPFVYEGISYRTNEHFYVAMKTDCIATRKQISEIHSPGKVKRLGRTLELRDSWENDKMNVMFKGLCYKFSKSNPNLRQKLIDTGNQYIQEGNTWGDSFWGYDLIDECGKNKLGELIMHIRNIINMEEAT